MIRTQRSTMDYTTPRTGSVRDCDDPNLEALKEVGVAVYLVPNC